jgi:CRP/FNR family transcriptional regulator
MHDSGNTKASLEQRSSLDELLESPLLGARQLEAAAGTVLFEPDTAARHLYFVRSGQVRVYQVGPDDSARLLEILGPGDWCGVGALAEEASPHAMRAVVVSRAVVSEVPAEAWLTSLSQNPAVATQWIGRLAGKLQQAREDAACLVFDDCNRRLIKTLLQFSRTAAASPQPDGVVLRITHQQLAQAVGAARETISLALTQLRQQNLLRTGRNQLFFNPKTLEQFARQPALAPERVA